jgi:hypothetical protein
MNVRKYLNEISNQGMFRKKIQQNTVKNENMSKIIVSQKYDMLLNMFNSTIKVD